MNELQQQRIQSCLVYDRAAIGYYSHGHQWYVVVVVRLPLVTAPGWVCACAQTQTLIQVLHQLLDTLHLAQSVFQSSK